jgi:soluble lytic murein transglycosylase-like protein
MQNVERAVIPGMIAGCLFLIYFASLLTDPNRLKSLASSQALSAAGALSAGAGAAHVVEAGQAQQHEPTPTPEPTETPPPVEAALVEQPADSDNGCAISASYPAKIQRWCDQISREAREHNVDANLIAAVMLQESGGNPDAYSKSGAVGLMQVMPRDGLAASFQCKNGPCFSKRPSMDELFDPDFNIDYGTRMLAGLIGRTGSVREALFAYGPMDMGYRYADIVLGHYQRYQ